MSLENEDIKPMGVDLPEMPKKYVPFEVKYNKYIVCCVCDTNNLITELLDMQEQDKPLPERKIVSHSYCNSHYEEAKKEIREKYKKDLPSNDMGA